MNPHNYTACQVRLKEVETWCNLNRLSINVTSQGERMLRDMGFQYSKTNI